MATQPEPVLLTNGDPGFYPALGPFLASHEVHRFIDGVPWDEDTKIWFVLKDTAGQLRGFCAVNQTASRTRRTLLESLYVLPAQEQEEALDTLVQAAVHEFGHDRDLHATVRHHIATAHKKAGFREVKTTKNMTFLVRPADIRSDR
ncbi:hypothetical protein OG413_40895 [Streptomyces sp. NBC_01433]|uniref:hypothetical protein n=1 Tax=Streptomyces sp. NBC_01433 TaxID=2903864 RepID=UPI0022595C03|nr:hypothetical protein [Streptomyces sp. NBC_01433]MCX4681561.1 hypothetical protein [Streptomyces sp. NBC_01433]